VPDAETSSRPDGLLSREEIFASRIADWELWREWMENSSRCEIGRRAGVWALRVWEHHLGADWLGRVVESEGRPPPEVSGASYHAVAFAELLRHAIYLEIGNGLSGYARVRTPLRTDLREERRVHTMMQLEVAMLARACGAQVSLEDRTLTPNAPLDVFATFGNLNLAVETFAVLHDDTLKAGRELSDRVSQGLLGVMFQHNVHLVGDLTDELTDDVAASLISAVDAAAKTASENQVECGVAHPLSNLRVVPQVLAESGTGFSLSAGTGRGWERTVGILRRKADQARVSGATWLRVDLHDSMWQLTPWAQSPLPEKTRALASWVARALEGMEGVRGVVLSSGAVSALGTRLGETTWPGADVVGLRRDIDAFRGRETIIVPLTNGALEEAKIWFGLYNNEPMLLNNALAGFGFPPLSELAEFEPSDV
jgi:hypothetical protein